jgi:hypothetical protein
LNWLKLSSIACDYNGDEYEDSITVDVFFERRTTVIGLGKVYIPSLPVN